MISRRVRFAAVHLGFRRDRGLHQIDLPHPLHSPLHQWRALCEQQGIQKYLAIQWINLAIQLPAQESIRESQVNRRFKLDWTRRDAAQSSSRCKQGQTSLFTVCNGDEHPFPPYSQAQTPQGRGQDALHAQ
jgi:hypothetical protein